MIFLTNSVDELTNAAEDLKNIDMNQLQTWLNNDLLPWLKSMFFLIIQVILIYLIGRKIVKWITKAVDRMLTRSSMEEGATGFIVTVLKFVLNFILFVIIASVLGLETSSLVAIVGSAGLAIGLALQGSLSNFAGGILILVLKPFRVGDYIIAGSKEGTVTKIDICYTKMLTIDNKLVVMPNGNLSNMDIINTTNEPERRLDLNIPVEYKADLKKVKDVLTSVARSCDSVLLDDHEIEIYVYKFATSSIELSLRVWCPTEMYWNLKWELQEKIMTRFVEEDIVIPFEQLEVTMVQADK